MWFFLYTPSHKVVDGRTTGNELIGKTFLTCRWAIEGSRKFFDTFFLHKKKIKLFIKKKKKKKTGKKKPYRSSNLFCQV